jgi:hypothetical protein
MNCHFGAGRIFFSPVGAVPTWSEIGNVTRLQLDTPVEVTRAKDARKGVWLTRDVFVDDVRTRVELDFSDARISNLLEVTSGRLMPGGSISLGIIHRPKVAIKYEGVNLENAQNVLVELWEVAFDDLGSFALLSDDYAEFTLGGEACFSTDRLDDVVGHLGRLIYL